MNTAVTTPQSFEERVYQRMRENIGELMTDEEMKKLLQRALDKMFFSERVTTNGWGQETSRLRPVIYDIVAELVEPTLRKALAAHLAEHHTEVMAAVEKSLAGGLVASTARAIDSLTAESFLQLQGTLSNLVANLRAKGSL